MSILSNLLDDLFTILFPAHCVGCNQMLYSRKDVICNSCWSVIPLTGFHMNRENPMELRIKAICPYVESVASQFFYINKGNWRGVIHQIKYHHSWRTAYLLGYAYGCQLAQSPDFQAIELVVPVPLHPFRQISRGYNQSELIARGVAKALRAKVDSRTLKRVKYNKSQVRTRTKGDRWHNVQNIFALNHPKRLAGKRVLLVDDVFTTGATIVECIRAINKVCECQISVATLAVSYAEIMGKGE